ncbi:hypothetical protein PIB30_011238 [Stylosanthes scabra]|uniref:Uncharacterized protein n=1 Tax=Stylosanthes scabra TaxID=79078 RepID=A0ABU6T7U3_9FABA|nr:hypothetical protein [Stylosanthes scabra]
MSSFVGWLPVPDDYLGIKPKYGSLTVKCRGPSSKRPTTPLRKRVLRVPQVLNKVRILSPMEPHRQEEHHDHLEPLGSYPSA